MLLQTLFWNKIIFWSTARSSRLSLQIVSLNQMCSIHVTPDSYSISHRLLYVVYTLTLKLVRIIARGWGTFLPILVFLGRSFLDVSANSCRTHHVTLRTRRSRHLSVIRVFVLHSTSVPSFKFVSLSLRTIRRTSGLNVSWLGDLDVWPLTLKLVRIIARGVSNFPTNFGVSRTFHSRLIDQQLSYASRDLATLTFDLGRHGACRPCGSSCCVCVYQVLNF